MKIFCDRKDLDRAINIVNKAISPNNTLPVLNNILLKSEGKTLHFSSTNLEIAITCSIDADVRAEGAVTVPAKLITPYVSLLTDERVEISVSGGSNIEIKSSSSETKINGINADEFPLIPKVEDGKEMTVKVDELYETVTETVFATSSNTSRPVLSGVFVTSSEDGVKMVATDSYRLAEKGMEVVGKPEEDVSCIVPARTVLELSKILGKSTSKEVKIFIAKNQVLFKVNGIELISRLIEGRYPDYKKIIPQGSKTSVELSVEDLTLILKRVSIFARENNNSVKLAVGKDNKLTITSEETKVGEERAELSVKLTGEENTISLNAQYLLDVLSAVNTDKIILEMNDKASPAVVKPLEKEDYVYIIMPLKV